MAPTTRSSTRSNTQNSAALIAVEEPAAFQASSDYGELDTELAKPKPRKRKHKDLESITLTGPPVKRARRKQGRLKGIMNMPIEVFTEIAKYLYPLDLILLSRANKFFRELLLNRSAVQTWRHSLANVSGLPPCPAGLCEPKYAALVFSKHCSMCGNHAPRQMDPALQVRLCTSCRDHHLVQCGHREFGLVPISDTIVPTSKRRAQLYCLREEVEAIHTKLDAFVKVRDTAAEVLWRQGRRKDADERMKRAQPLIKFLRQVEAEQEDDIATRRSQRETEVHARLLALGWVKGDLQMREPKAAKQWNSLVCIAKPLTERNWDTILPQLTPLLEQSQKLRLVEEASNRRAERLEIRRTWVTSNLGNLPPYAWVLGHVQSEISSIGEPNFTTSDSAHAQQQSTSQHLEAGANTLWMPTPPASIIERLDSFRQLVEPDRPTAEFRTALEELRPTFDDHINKWRTELELALKDRLPANEALPPADTSINPGTLEVGALSLVPKLDILVGGKPVDALPAHVQQLLRPDTIFKYTFSDSVYFYPEAFRGWYHEGAGSLEYHATASNIANRLLAALGRPDAMRLEVQAVGSGFSCGRCSSRNCVDWKTLVEHYCSEQRTWDKVRSWESFKNGEATYVFTHNTEQPWNDKPLVKMSTDEDLESAYRPSAYRRHYCKMCIMLGSYCAFTTDTLVMEHLRDVHLIQEPEVNKHFD